MFDLVKRPTPVGVDVTTARVSDKPISVVVRRAPVGGLGRRLGGAVLVVMALCVFSASTMAQVSFVIPTADDPIAVANNSFVTLAGYSTPFIAFLFALGILVAIGRMIWHVPKRMAGR